MNRRTGQLTTHRVVMGALALILIFLGVVVAFRSTRGVPLVPRYNLDVEVPTAGKLTAGADIMIAGNRVGNVTDVKAVVSDEGTPAALMSLGISKKYEPLPADSTFSVHLIGALGHKYIEIRPGSSSQDLADGAYVPLSGNPNSDTVTDIDQVLNTQTESARAGTRSTFEALGMGLAGRGMDINGFLEHFPTTLKESAAAQRIINAPSTNLAGLISGLNSFYAELAPTTPVIPQLVTDLDLTFRAFDSSKSELQDAIGKSPEALATLTKVIPVERRLFAAGAVLMHKLQPGAAVLPETAPVLADALEAGANNLQLVPKFAQRLTVGTDYLADYATYPGVVPGSLRVAETANALYPLMNFITPAETTCSYLSLMLRNLNSTLAESLGTGTATRATGVVVDTQRNSERGPSSSISLNKPGKTQGALHSNPYPNTASPGQTYECEAGNEPYIQNRPVIGNVPGQQKATTEDPLQP